MSIIKQIAFAIVLLWASLAHAQTITLGETNKLGYSDNDNAGLLTTQGPYHLSQPASLNSLSFWVTNRGGRLILGIYTAGPNNNCAGGTLVAQTAAFNTTSNAWNTAKPTASAMLPAGNYCLAYQPSSNSLSFRKGVSTGILGYWYSRSFGPLPATYPSNPTSGPNHWSLYATLTPGAPVPIISFNPANPSISANAAAATVVSQVQVAMSDGSQYTGSLAYGQPYEDDSGAFVLSSPTLPANIVVGADISADAGTTQYVTIAASASVSANLAINVASSQVPPGVPPGACPFTGGATANDGCTNAPAGTPQLTAAGVLGGSDLSGQAGKNLLTGVIYPHVAPYCNSRTAGTGYGFVNSQPATGGSASPSSTPCPNWNVPGVDYYVGCWLTVCAGATGAPNGGGGLVAGKDPSNPANWPAGCCSLNGTTLTVSGSNVTLSGFDYCNYPLSDPGTAVQVTGNNVTLTNSYWCTTAGNINHGLNINSWVFATGSNFTISYNTYDGGCDPGAGGTSLPCNSTINNTAESWWADVEPNASNSTWLSEYNYCYNVATACYASNSAWTTNPSITFRYNLSWNWGLNTAQNHEDDIHFCGSGPVNNALKTFNTNMPMSYHTALAIDAVLGRGNSPSISYLDGWFDLGCSGFTANNAQVDHDVIIDPGIKNYPNNVGAAVEPVYFWSRVGTGSGDFRSSYVDWSGGASPFNINQMSMNMSAPSYGLLSGGTCDPRIDAGGSACQ